MFCWSFYIPDWYKSQEMCDNFFWWSFFINQQMCGKAGDDCLDALKFVRDWFVTNKMIKILFTALYADEIILYFDEDSVRRWRKEIDPIFIK